MWETDKQTAEKNATKAIRQMPITCYECRESICSDLKELRKTPRRGDLNWALKHKPVSHHTSPGRAQPGHTQEQKEA